MVAFDEPEMVSFAGAAGLEISRGLEPFLSLRLFARQLDVDPGRRSKIFQNLLGWPFWVTCGLIY